MQLSRDSAEQLVALGKEVAPGASYTFDLSKPVLPSGGPNKDLGGNASAMGEIQQGEELFGIYAVSSRFRSTEPVITILDMRGKQHKLKPGHVGDIRDYFSAELAPDSQTLTVTNLSDAPLRVHGKQEPRADQVE